ncbi:hypothetical protein [Arsenicicoccus dermatophilus]|uniref:hypothetical protein n=1 Tax=Arsenicicoccus dermatophilus TaxID=1076331 RepID=UPI003916E202
MSVRRWVGAVGCALLGACHAPAPDPLLPTVVRVVQDRAPATTGPTFDRRADEMATAVRALVAGQDVRPQPRYVLARVATSTGERAWALVPQGMPTTGEGLYVARPPGTAAALAVEIPHPRSDRFTDEMGTAVFERTRARALLMAGSLRDAGDDADVAHAGDAVFAAVDRAVVAPGWVVLQLHGFSRARHPHYPAVVVAGGATRPGPVLRGLADGIGRAGFPVLVAEDGRGEQLAARTNVEGRHAARVGAQFVHVEADDRVRDDPALRGLLVDAIVHVLREVPVP